MAKTAQQRAGAEKDGQEQWHVGGGDADAPSPAEKERRQQRLQDEIRQMEEEAEAEKSAATAKPGKDRQDHHRDRSLLGHVYLTSLLKVETHDDHFKVRGGNPPQPGMPRTVSDRQLRAIIISAALEKDWRTLYLYKDRSTIDPQLTARAAEMIRQMQRPGQPLEGIDLKVSQTRMRTMEPWNEGRLLYSAFRSMGERRAEVAAAVGNSLSGVWNRSVTGLLFKGAAAAAAPAASVITGSAVAASLGGVFTAKATESAAEAAPAAEAATVTEVPAVEAETRRAAVAAGVGAPGKVG